MRRPCVRYRLRSILILIALAGVALGCDRVRRRWRAFRASAAVHAQEAHRHASEAHALEESARRWGQAAELEAQYARDYAARAAQLRHPPDHQLPTDWDIHRARVAERWARESLQKAERARDAAALDLARAAEHERRAAEHERLRRRVLTRW